MTPQEKSRATVLQVLHLTSNGMTQREACQQLGLRYDSTSRAVRRYQRSLMTPEDAAADTMRWQKKPDRNSRIWEDWKRGMLLPDIAAKYGIHAAMAHTIIMRDPGYVGRYRRK
jgi:hypothetical protein